MNRYLKNTIIITGVIILLLILDLICIFTINRPLLAIKEDNGDSVNLIYRGIIYDTYKCQEYSSPQIKSKNTKFNCNISRIDIGKVTDIVDTTKQIKDFACAEALQSFYKDENYTYYWDCIKNKYMIVKYESGYEETISNALKYGTITIGDLEKYNINYYKEPYIK